jgi:hypothetical protein
VPDDDWGRGVMVAEEERWCTLCGKRSGGTERKSGERGARSAFYGQWVREEGERNQEGGSRPTTPHGNRGRGLSV